MGSDVCPEFRVEQEATMLKILSALALTLVWTVALAALMAPGLSTIKDGLESGKRIALARYAEQHAEAEQP
jgi:hypothetical protein